MGSIIKLVSVPKDNERVSYGGASDWYRYLCESYGCVQLRVILLVPERQSFRCVLLSLSGGFDVIL